MSRLPRFQKFLSRFGLHRPELLSWAMYDWANSAFVLVIVTAVFPIYYSSVASSTLASSAATAYFGWTTTLVLAVVALASPVLGAMADYLGWRKRMLAFSIAAGVVPTALLFFVKDGDYLPALLLFACGNLGLSVSFVFYDSLLPHIAREEEMDRVSSGGYALGYLGSGLLLVLIILWIENPAEWGFADSGTATRTGFFAVALWWTVFSIPILRNLREPARLVESDEAGTAGAVRAAFHRLLTTFREFKGDHRQAFILLLAILVYSDGIGTIIRMAAIYASTQGLPQSDVILAILIVQFVGVPFSSLFGWMAGRIGTRNAIFIGLAVYSVITVVAFFMDTVLEFYVMAVLVATVQGGTQALSRSLFASMIPKHRTSEYFGFFSVSDKVAGILGPLVFSTLLTVTGSSRLAILSVLVFFLGGGILLWFVNVGLGHEEARNAERRAVRNTNQPAI